MAGRPGIASRSAATWAPASTRLMAHVSTSSRASRSRASEYTQNSTMGGRSDTDATAVAVMARSICPARTDTTVTPPASLPIVAR